jgi:hypothetical protein
LRGSEWRLRLRNNLGRPIISHLEHRFRPIEVFEGVLTKAPQRHLLRQVVATKIIGDCRYQGLPATTQSNKPRDPIECRTKVIAVAQFRRAAVQSHPHANPDRFRPGLGGQRVLRVYRGFQRIGCRDESGANSVANGLHHVAAVSFNALPQ